MRSVPDTMYDAWNDGVFIGDQRPVARVTVGHPRMKMRSYSLTTTYTEKITSASIKSIIEGDFTAAGTFIDFTHGHKVRQYYADFFLTSQGKPREMPNVKSVTWNRSTDQDVADCTIELWNSKPLPIGVTPRDDELDYPGYYTYDRGGTSFSAARWGHERNEWFGYLVPDNIVRTYEGYGCDTTKIPEFDPFLVQTGTWLIDTVTMTAGGTMSLKCRDVGRILIDQYYFPPVVPKNWYDEGDWSSWDEEFEINKSGSRLKVTPEDSSNTPWIGNSLTHSVSGHTLQHAFDGDPNSYWLSIGNDKPSRRYAYEWVQCKVNSQSVSQIKVRPRKSGYTCYVSVMVGGAWQGAEAINYHEDGIGMNGASIKYVKKVSIPEEKEITIDLPKTYEKVTRVRITFGNLQNFNIGTYKYRAGIAQVNVYSPDTTGKKKLTPGPAGSNPNKYSDYTDIVKLICCWGGFFWPEKGHQRASDGFYYIIKPGKFDEGVLGKGTRGRVFGDFQDCGVTGVSDLSRSNFDQKPLMDGIAYIKNILGFIFFIDELGGVQWRFPNIVNRGCYEATMSAHPGYHAGFAFTIDETKVLITLESTLDQRNVRESNFVGDFASKIGAYAPGFNPNPTGLRRIGAWTDGNFEPADSTKAAARNARKEAQLTAELISLGQLFTYRTDKVRIPAYPAIQIDDQVRIWERTTAEGYYHYVKGISSSLDVDSGQWTYDLDTHWLGYSPDSQWIYNPKTLHQDTQDYLDLQKKFRDAVIKVDRRLTQDLLDTSDGF